MKYVPIVHQHPFSQAGHSGRWPVRVSKHKSCVEQTWCPFTCWVVILSSQLCEWLIISSSCLFIGCTWKNEWVGRGQILANAINCWSFFSFLLMTVGIFFLPFSPLASPHPPVLPPWLCVCARVEVLRWCDILNVGT